ncbi:phosphoribosylglycinamide formyltransferase [Bdellovibrionota bacterium FG-1]
MIPIAVFASGRGSNLEALIQAIHERRLDAEIVAVVSDCAESLALQKAQTAGLRVLPIAVPSATASGRRELHEELILEALRPWAPRFLVMAGYRRVLSSHLIEAFRSERGYSRIVNIHPALLPAFPGLESYRQAFQYGVKLTGATVHLVEAEVDAGPICAQEAFSITDCQTVEEVERRGLALEHRLFSQTLAWILPEKFEVQTVQMNVRSPQGFAQGVRLNVRPY